MKKSAVIVVERESRKGRRYKAKYVRLDTGEITSYTSLHRALRRQFKKSGRCHACGQSGKTDWALRADRTTYSRRIEAYNELCPTHHNHVQRGYKVMTVLGTGRG